MSLRIFKVTIKPEFRREFERDFRSISVETVKSQEGLISCHIGAPTRVHPDDYVMITRWTSESALRAFAGENWNAAVIPEAMRRYPRAFSVEHYEAMEFAGG
jgi:heme-degrading monooxygenase HmoA